MGFEGAQSKVKTRRTKDLGVSHTAALESQERCIAFGAHLLDFEAVVEAVRRRHFIDDGVGLDAAAPQRPLRQTIHQRRNARVISSQLQAIAKMANEERDGFAVVNRQKTDGSKAVSQGDLLGTGVREPIVGKANV